MGKPVTCRKIESTRNRFSSFHVTAECNEIADMYDPQLWPAGIYVRRYFEARKPRVNSDGTALGSEGGGDLQEHRPVPDLTSAGLQKGSSIVGAQDILN